MYDTVIVGGGPAGLNAALVLGRCRRRVLLCDTRSPRNKRSRALRGFLTRDGIRPVDLLQLGREELRPYGIEFRDVEVVGIQPTGDAAFELTLQGGDRLAARTVLIASGIEDMLPPIPGLADCFGISVHHCPYCDGWEVSDRPLAVIGQRSKGAALALALKTWSDRVTLCSNGPAQLRANNGRRLEQHGIVVNEIPIAALEHTDGQAQHLVFADGGRLACDAVFVSTVQRPQCDLPRQLGCVLTRRGLVKTDHLGRTAVPGLYVAGDASRDVQFAIVAAAEGAKAAVAINTLLQERTGLAVTA